MGGGVRCGPVEGCVSEWYNHGLWRQVLQREAEPAASLTGGGSDATSWT